MEYSPCDNMLAYTEAGDMKLDLRVRHTGTFIFPSRHYHGLTIAFDREIASRTLPLALRDFPVTLEALIARWELADHPLVLHSADMLAHIFGELYCVPEKIRIPYFKVKILELLLYLDAMAIPGKNTAPRISIRPRWRRSRPSMTFSSRTLLRALRRRNCPAGLLSP